MAQHRTNMTLAMRFRLIARALSFVPPRLPRHRRTLQLHGTARLATGQARLDAAAIVIKLGAQAACTELATGAIPVIGAITYPILSDQHQVAAEVRRLIREEPTSITAYNGDLAPLGIHRAEFQTAA